MSTSELRLSADHEEHVADLAAQRAKAEVAPVTIRARFRRDGLLLATIPVCPDRLIEIAGDKVPVQGS